MFGLIGTLLHRILMIDVRWLGALFHVHVARVVAAAHFCYCWVCRCRQAPGIYASGISNMLPPKGTHPRRFLGPCSAVRGLLIRHPSRASLSWRKQNGWTERECSTESASCPLLCPDDCSSVRISEARIRHAGCVWLIAKANVRVIVDVAEMKYLVGGKCLHVSKKYM
ncbi:hypothetical protein F5X97DRAFT_39994 [Nemania serpens]|nr:hypothetical protein F5X97DRAFT_39994 [Nemania serpens]